MDVAIDSIARRLRQARHVLILTGAGVSAESGVPTFREAQTGPVCARRAQSRSEAP